MTRPRPRARALELLADSERLEKELWELTERLQIFTAELQGQLAAEGKGGDEHGATNTAD